jgi:hypothetical protein
MGGILTFEMPEKIEDIDEKAADSYFKTFISTSAFLKSEVIDPIKEALKRKTGYSDYNLPKERVIEQDFKIGKSVFTVKTILEDKRPSYGSIFSDLLDYLYFAEERVRFGIKSDDVIVLKENPYIRLDILVKIFTKKKDMITLTGIKQEINYKIPDEVPQQIIVPVLDYSKLPPEAEKLPEYDVFHDELVSRVITSFRNLLKKSVKTEEWKEMGKYLFKIYKTTSSSVAYGKIYDDLFFKYTELSTKKRQDGELVLMAELRESSLTKDVLETYEFKRYNKEKTVFGIASIRGLKKRIEQLVEKYKTESSKINFLVYPIL